MTYPRINTQGSRPSRTAALRVGLVLVESYTLSALALFLDPLRLAREDQSGDGPARIEWTLMSKDGHPVRSSCGVETAPDGGLIPPSNFDYLVIVGGVMRPDRQPHAGLEKYLKEAALQGVVLVGLCTGSFVLARAGLMQGRTACVSWYHYQDFVEEFPHQAVVADRLFLDTGDRITCAGGASAADLATFLIERHVGWPVAQKVSQLLLFDRTRAGGDAQPHPSLSILVSDGRLRRALLMMEQNVTQPLAITELSRRLCMSTRQFERLCRAELGLSPSGVYRQLRMRFAHWLIRYSDRSITEIAMSAGFADCGHFSRQFKTVYGYSPSHGRRDQEGAEADGELASARVFG